MEITGMLRLLWNCMHSYHLHLLSEKAVSDILSRLIKCCRLSGYLFSQILLESLHVTQQTKHWTKGNAWTENESCLLGKMYVLRVIPSQDRNVNWFPDNEQPQESQSWGNPGRAAVLWVRSMGCALKQLSLLMLSRKATSVSSSDMDRSALEVVNS